MKTKEEKIIKAHFVAIGGLGMSGIATVLMDRGVLVSGSDIKSTHITESLAKRGAHVYRGHEPTNIEDPDIVVVSSAISADNPEVVEARRRGIPVVHRMDMLLKAVEGQKIIAVSGTHGKTTTSAMISWILEKAGQDPTYLIGGELADTGNAKTGKGLYAVVETDESDGSFLKCHPDINVVTNIDNDHLEFWGDFDALKNGFYTYLDQTKSLGFKIVCSDNVWLEEWASRNPGADTYGVKSDALWEAKAVRKCGWKTTCRVFKNGDETAFLELPVPGIHNLQNALGAVAASSSAGLNPQIACEHLREFPGVNRRLQRIGKFGGVLLLDDFAHHPNEIAAVLATIKAYVPGSRIVALFQPHRYSRTKLLYHQFAQAFLGADAVVVTGIYSGPGERLDAEVNPGVISKAIEDAGHHCVSKIDDLAEAAELAAKLSGGQGVLITLGAGNVWESHRLLSKALES